MTEHDIVEVARAMVLTKGHGHNDPPFYEDYEPPQQKLWRHAAGILIEYLNRLGYEIIPKPEIAKTERELADKVFDLLRLHDVHLVLDAMGMTLLRVVMSSKPAAGKTREQIVKDWLDHFSRSTDGLDSEVGKLQKEFPDE